MIGVILVHEHKYYTVIKKDLFEHFKAYIMYRHLNVGCKRFLTCDCLFNLYIRIMSPM